MRTYKPDGEQYVVVRRSPWEVPLTILTIILGVPIGRALWLAMDNIFPETWEAIGVIFIGILFFVFIGAATTLFYLWVRQPGQQLPGFMNPIERRLEQ